MGFSLRNIGKKIWDQANMWDNNRTWQNPTPTNTKSAWQQTGQLGGQTARATVGNAAKFVNTGVNQARQVYNTAAAEVALRTHNNAAINEAFARQRRADEMFKEGSGGLLNVGTMYNADDARNGNLTGVRKIVEGTGMAGLDVASLMTGASVGKSVAQNGLKVGLRSEAGNLAKSGLINTVQGGAQTYKDGGRGWDIAKGAALSGAVGTAADVGLGVGYGLVQPKLKVGFNNAMNSNLAMDMGGSVPNTVEVNAAKKLVADIEAKAAKANRNTTVNEEIKIAKAYEKAGVDPATVPAGKNMPNTNVNKKNPYTTDVTLQDPGRWGRFWKSTNGIISEYGEVGKQVAEKIHATREFSEVKKAELFNAIPTVRGLNKDEMVQFADTLDTLSKGKKVKNVSPNVQTAVKEWRRAIPKVLADARAAGIEMGDLGPNYFPRFYKDLDSPKLVDRLMKEAAGKGKPITRAEAVKQVKFIREANVRKYGHLEKSRTGDYGGFEKSHEAIANYVEGAYDRIARAKEFGANDELLDQAKAQLLEQGFDVNDLPNKKSLFSKYVDIARGDTDRSTTGWKASNAVRQVNAVTSLSAAGISNAGQLTNTAAVGGIGRTIKNMLKVSNDNFQKKYLSKEALNIANKSGVALDHQIKMVTEATQGTTNKITRNIASPFFAAIEKFNREVTALTGADYGNHLAAKVVNGDVNAERLLRDKLGVKGKIGNQLTDAQQIQAARKLVEISQFKVDPMDMPGWVESPMGKLAMQFRSFGYKQTGFIYNEVLQEARKGNFAPLARFITVGVPVGLAGSTMKDTIKFKDKEEDTRPLVQQAPGRALKGVSEVGGFGMPGSVAQSLKRGFDYGTPVTSAISTVGGPTVGTTIETVDNLMKAQRGNTDPLVKMGVRKIPMVGPTAAGILSKEGMPLESSYKGEAKAPKEGEKPTPKYIKEQTDKEIKEIEDRETLDYSVKKLSDGRYAFTIPGQVDIQYADNLNDYHKKAAEAMFKQGTDPERTVHGWHFSRNADGSVSSERQYMYEFNKEDSQNQLDMYIAKDDEDYGAWTAAATKQLAALEKKKEQLKKDNQTDGVADTQKAIETLKQQMEKYKGYGGAFKKGRSGGGGGGSGSDNIISPSRYGVSMKSYNGGGKVSIKGADAKTLVGKSGAKRGSSSKPKVTIKKSLV